MPCFNMGGGGAVGVKVAADTRSEVRTLQGAQHGKKKGERLQEKKLNRKRKDPT